VKSLTLVNDLACLIANSWRQQRRESRVIDAMDANLVRQLDELDRLTLGAPRRCICLGGRSGGSHSFDCPGKP